MRVASLATLVAGARAMSLKAGAQVPKFAVTAHTGAAVSSDSLAGSAYCLWFYPKADTGGATTAWTRGAFKLTTMHCGDGVLGSSTLDDDHAIAATLVPRVLATPRHRRDTLPAPPELRPRLSPGAG